DHLAQLHLSRANNGAASASHAQLMTVEDAAGLFKSPAVGKQGESCLKATSAQRIDAAFDVRSELRWFAIKNEKARHGERTRRLGNRPMICIDSVNVHGGAAQQKSPCAASIEIVAELEPIPDLRESTAGVQHRFTNFIRNQYT